MPNLFGLCPIRSLPDIEGPLHTWWHHHHNVLWSWPAWVWGSSSGAKLILHRSCNGIHHAGNRNTWSFFYRLCPLQPACHSQSGRRTAYSEILLFRRAANSLGASCSCRVHWTGPSVSLQCPGAPDIQTFRLHRQKYPIVPSGLILQDQACEKRKWKRRLLMWRDYSCKCTIMVMRHLKTQHTHSIQI